jgi:hypothetical protein
MFLLLRRDGLVSDLDVAVAVDGHLTYRYCIHYLFFRYDALCVSL